MSLEEQPKYERVSEAMAAPAPRAYCFDLDGTLIDSEVIWVDAVASFIRERQPDYPMVQAEQLVYGRSWHDIYADIVRMNPGFEMSLEDMEAAIAPFYKAIAAARDIRIHSSIQLLRELAEVVPVCIVSGSSRKTVGEAIEMMGVGDDLRFYLGADDYSPGKPDPACYRMAADQLGVAPADCMVFEDSHAGLMSAKEAGMRCVILVSEDRPIQDFSVADAVLKDLADYTHASGPVANSQ